ncbi:ANTH-domain-containing protein [Gonapodya prolifera JEL478]|uniref:ANTH-domain-containing protein n=1 Tax=Gonapodya prolifera (strain JEL478) TaxID=1344416 RepID=A0A139AD44_GONPJ|nr:ANTH-domain-containing protein [Gonapodya prolifera JEL478]|eukprot:KXS14365.1 ANTH-domain-containing protein [Gonapodya prolifera JEL478]
MRIAEAHWATAFKSVILIHLIIREGPTDHAINYLSKVPSFLNVAGFRDRSGDGGGLSQTKNLRAYARYIEERVMICADMKQDPTRNIKARDAMVQQFRSAKVDTAYLSNVALLQRFLDGVLACKFEAHDIDNIVTLQAFRLLLADCIPLFHIVNEVVIKILDSFFVRPKPEAMRALSIYRSFSQQSDKTADLFEMTRNLRHSLGFEIPTLRKVGANLALSDFVSDVKVTVSYPTFQTPASLLSSLESYVKDPNFEPNRESYLEKKGTDVEKPEHDSRVRSQSAKPTAAKAVVEQSPLRSRTATAPAFGASNAMANTASAALRNEVNELKSARTKFQSQPQLIDFFASLDDELPQQQQQQQQQQYQQRQQQQQQQQPQQQGYGNTWAGAGTSAIPTLPYAHDPFAAIATGMTNQSSWNRAASVTYPNNANAIGASASVGAPGVVPQYSSFSGRVGQTFGTQQSNPFSAIASTPMAPASPAFSNAINGSNPFALGGGGTFANNWQQTPLLSSNPFGAQQLQGPFGTSSQQLQTNQYQTSVQAPLPQQMGTQFSALPITGASSSVHPFVDNAPLSGMVQPSNSFGMQPQLTSGQQGIGNAARPGGFNSVTFQSNLFAPSGNPYTFTQ